MMQFIVRLPLLITTHIEAFDCMFALYVNVIRILYAEHG